jgi:hypothetical protein
MRTVIQAILVIWFVVISLFLFVPSFLLLTGVGLTRQTVPQPPVPPPLIAALANPPSDPKLDIKVLEELGKTYAQQVSAYTQQVTSYKEQLAAYKVYVEASSKGTLAGAYQLVVKETLGTLLTTFATALLGYVFIKGGAGLVNNILLARRGQPGTSLDI